MTLSLLLDMNISPSWASLLRAGGVNAVHWSDIGAPDAADKDVMAYAQAHGHIVVTHDLDFTHLLALTRAAGPSVILLRWQFAAPENAVSEILRIASSHDATLSAGALIVIDTVRSRVRILPIRHAED